MNINHLTLKVWTGQSYLKFVPEDKVNKIIRQLEDKIAAQQSVMQADLLIEALNK